MFASVFRAVKAALLYMRAGTSLEKANYELAAAQMLESRHLLRERASKPSLFSFDLRASEIYIKLGDMTRALECARSASKKIVAYKALTANDRNYLLDYCDQVIMDASQEDELPNFRLMKDDYHLVSARYRNEYPLVWD